MAEGTTQAPRGGARKAERERLDVLLVERGLAPSRERARALIMAREVRVDGRIVDKAGTLVPRSAECALSGSAAELRYVSRGGLKLEHALDAFGLDPSSLVCLDVGASTGGFTDVLLRRGAARVYAVDVGRGQLAWSLRTDPRVIVLDRTNVRHLVTLPERGDCAVIDVSFISLRLVLPPVAALVRPGAWIVALVKPQFEAGRAEADRGAGVISDPRVHRRILHELVGWLDTPRGDHPPAAEAADTRLAAQGLSVSPITGREGNHEYLLHLAVLPVDAAASSSAVTERDIARAVDEAFAESEP